MKKKSEREKPLKIGYSIVIVSPTLIDISKVVKIDKKIKTATLSNGLVISLFYQKDTNIRTLNSNTKYLAVLKKGPLANKYLAAWDLLKNIRMFTDRLYQISLSRYGIMEDNNTNKLIKMNDIIENCRKEFEELYNQGLPF